MTVSKLLRVLSVLEPFVEQVADWLDGDDPEMPPLLRELPAELKSQIELRLLRARMDEKKAQSA